MTDEWRPPAFHDLSQEDAAHHTSAYYPSRLVDGSHSDSTEYCQTMKDSYQSISHCGPVRAGTASQADLTV